LTPVGRVIMRSGQGCSRWQTVWLYDTPQLFHEGTGSNTAKTASDIPLGKATPDDVWKVGLIGAAVSSARGAINGWAGNVL
jgi:hypothetical protein